MCQNVMHYSSMHSREVSVKPVFAKLPKDNHNGYIVLLNKSALIKSMVLPLVHNLRSLSYLFLQ